MTHPVVAALHERPVGSRIALVVEGGGMRGAVSGGMALGLDELGLAHAFDAAYGSSAGTLNAMWLVSGRVPSGAVVRPQAETVASRPGPTHGSCSSSSAAGERCCAAPWSTSAGSSRSATSSSRPASSRRCSRARPSCTRSRPRSRRARRSISTARSRTPAPCGSRCAARRRCRCSPGRRSSSAPGA